MLQHSERKTVMAEIVLERFSKSYGSVEVLHEFDLTVGKGEFVALLGPSGCGKSTLLRMIAGLEDITSGTLYIDGAPMNDRPARDRDIAMVFQNYALYPHMTIYNNMAFGLRRLGLAREEIDRRITRAASMLGLDPLLARLPKQLSGGQQQRVAMGRALVKTPKVFLFDEPLSNLDAKLRDQLRIEIKKLHKLIKTTTVFVTHDQLEAMTLADKVVVMKDGRVEQVGSPTQVYNEPRSVFVSRFIGSPAINLLPVRVVNDGARVRLEGDGFVVRLPQRPHAGLRPDQEVLLGIRPRDVRIADPLSADGICARFVLSETMGPETLVQIKVGDQEISMLVDESQAPELSESMQIMFRPDRLHLFDRLTELRLAGC
ncbi:ABC transporter ATP-binding protein [Lichenicoccus sp.]|uniref:ABC transporter ATP-binding protein n=1 Tax=Lichenicoccus sp. TaxID=2781899 RepID=UPI003D11C11A